MNNFKPPVQFDTEKSFYKWKIFLSNGKSFPGYSKGKDSPEIKDKSKLLFRIMTRLRRQQNKYPKCIYGYFTPGEIDRIEVYRNTGIGLYEEILIKFYPLYYQFGVNKKFSENKEVINFFKAFYYELLEGKIIQKESNQIYAGIGNSKAIDERRYFSLDNNRFKNINELNLFIGEGLSNGYNFEVMYNFRRQYIDKNFNNSLKLA